MTSLNLSSNKSYDVAIIGGGLSGAVAAYGLAEIGLTVALVESIEPKSSESASFDQRAVALSNSSVNILKSLSLWPSINSLATPIKNIHVSDKGNFGFARLAAKDFDLDALGEVLQLEQVGPLLWEQLKKQNKVETYCPWNLLSVKTSDSQTTVEIESIDQSKSAILSAKLVLACDGTFSKVAQSLEIPYTRNAYDQHAIVANVETNFDHQFRAFERFTNNGPLALLPLNQRQMSLVWCQSESQSERLAIASEEKFLAELQTAFGYRLGQFSKVSQRIKYPLASHWPKQTAKHAVLLMGNAAHTLHPIAGQGFNLGLRDIACLIELIIAFQVSKKQQFNPTVKEVETLLADLIASREKDWEQTLKATDGLVRIFSNDFLPLTILRNKGLSLFNRLPMIKRQFAFSAMGYVGKSPKLARGFSLQALLEAGNQNLERTS